MITVDGEAITPDPDGNGGGQDEDEALRAVRLELKLCRVLVAFDPPA